MRILLPSLFALLGAAGCRAAPPGAPLSAGAPRAWRLVEWEGRLALEPDDPGARTLVELRFSRPEAATSEVVEAEIRLPGSVGRRRIEVRPGRPDVRILGAAEVEIDGVGPARVRFTCGTAGPGGIIVLVKD
ncbi:MAG TPA: hypothetical protein VF950_28905 [Planctomycetota bacterium]